MDPVFKNKDGTLTRYALACGYIEKRGTDEAYVTLEQFSSNGALRVHVGGRWAREDIYVGPNLKSARWWFRHANAEARNNTWRERANPGG
jgi:hypothetical protein